MRISLLSFLTFVIFNPVSGQTKQDTIFYDINWKINSRNNAEFYRIIKKDPNTNKYNIKDYYISGQIYMEGLFSSLEPEVKDGIFTFWYRNGNKEKETEYKDGVFVKNIKMWDENGKENGEFINFYVIEEKPVYPGGEKAMLEFISQNVKYPKEAKKKKITGKVFVQFVIDKDGKVIDVLVFRGVHPLLDAEAVRVVQSMPAWKPGLQKGKLVKVSFQIPINFILRE